MQNKTPLPRVELHPRFRKARRQMAQVMRRFLQAGKAARLHLFEHGMDPDKLLNTEEMYTLGTRLLDKQNPPDKRRGAVFPKDLHVAVDVVDQTVKYATAKDPARHGRKANVRLSKKEWQFLGELAARPVDGVRKRDYKSTAGKLISVVGAKLRDALELTEKPIYSNGDGRALTGFASIQLTDIDRCAAADPPPGVEPDPDGDDIAAIFSEYSNHER